MRQRYLFFAMLVCGGIAAASHAQALGFGRLPESVAFGQTLDLSVPLRLEPGEVASPGCLRAEVHVGDQPVPASTLALTLERSADSRDEARVRLRSTVVVLEPLVAVKLSVGCRGAVARQFVAFADPSVQGADAPRSVQAEPPKAVEAPPAAAAAALHDRPASAAKPAVASRPAGVAPAMRVRATAPARTSAKTPHRSASQAVAPRLKLEEPDHRLQAAASASTQQAALAAAVQAAGVAQAAASAAEQQVAAMTVRMQALADEAQAQRAATGPMRERLAKAEGQGRWLQLVMAGLAALAVLAGWQAWHLRLLRRQQRGAWWHGAAEGAEAAPVPAGVATPAPPSAWSSMPAGAAVHPEPRHTDALPPQPSPQSLLSTSASVDEVIDLEQQVEFFTVLGEEDAALALLMAHLRKYSGGSPLPYLKLLEIQRGRNDREAYERLGERHLARFGVSPPPWQAVADPGRELQDHPAAIARLQACWNQPLDAMAELEGLLFHRRGGEILDLPAYRDVLTLYAVARDRQRRPDPTAVDVLLPLFESEEADVTPGPSTHDPFGAAAGRAALVDLDLSEEPPPDSRAGALRVTLP